MIYFRADGNSQIGLGHITRSLALADILAEYFSCIFLVQNPTPELIAQIQERHSLIKLPQSADYLIEAQQISYNYLSTDSIVVLDGYEFQTKYQCIIKKSGCKLVCIDDLHACHFVADVVINQAGGISNHDYLCEYYTKLYLGPDYALLREPFLKMARRELVTPEFFGHFITLIAMGGADPDNYTLKILKQVSIKSSGKFVVVLGSEYKYSDILFDYVNRCGTDIEVLKNLSAPAMASLMRRCRYAIIPPSGISYEYLCTGGVAYLKKIAENQTRMFNFLTSHGFAHSFDQYTQFPDKQRTATQLIDGKSSERISSVFLGLQKSTAITIRRAVLADVQIYFNWVSNSEVRANSINNEEISLEAHNSWFKNRLNNSTSVLYYFEYHNNPMAQVRFEYSKGNIEIDYSVDESFRGMGLGKIVLGKALQELKSEAVNWKHFPLNAQVKIKNIPSAKIFRSLRFEKLPPEKIHGETYLRFYKNQKEPEQAI